MSKTLVSTSRSTSLALLLGGASLALPFAAWTPVAPAAAAVPQDAQSDPLQATAAPLLSWDDILTKAGVASGMDGVCAIVPWMTSEGQRAKATGIIAEIFTTELTSSLQRHGARFVDGRQVAEGMQQTLAAAGKLAGDDGAKSLDALLANRVAATVIVEVTLSKQADGSLRPTLRLLDCRGPVAVDLYQATYIPLPADGLSGRADEPTAIRQAVTRNRIREITAKFLADAAPYAEKELTRPAPYYLFFHDLGDATRRDALLDALVDMASVPNAPIANVKPLGTELVEGGGLWGIEITFRGTRTSALTKIINGAFQSSTFKEGDETDANLAALLASEGKRKVIIYNVVPAGLARWEQFAPALEGENRVPMPWNQAYPLDRTPRLTIWTVTDGDAKGVFSGLSNGTDQAPAFDDEKLVNALGEWFSESGFEFIPVENVREALQRDMDNARALENHAGLVAALEQRTPVDFVVVVSKAPNSKEVAVQLLDLRHGARQLGLARWPDQTHLLYSGKIKPDNAASVARYLTGSLLADAAGWSAQRGPGSIEILIKNSLEPTKLMALIDRFKQMNGVSSISDLLVQQPVSSFRVNLTKRGTPDALMSELFKDLTEFGWPITIESAGPARIVLNLDFKLALPKKLDPQDMKATVAAVETNQASPLIAAMERARASVWVIGFESPDGDFFPSGTAWTVRDKLLATNAHVVEGLREQWREVSAKRPELVGQLKLVGRSGDGSNRRIELALDDMRSHPLYAEATQIFGAAGTIVPCDVGLISVASGDPGKPLQLASAADIKALKPLSPIGYVGFPMEGRSTFRQRPTQVSVLGVLNAVTTEFMQPSDDGMPELLHYDVTNGGGASGSPILGPNGTVIGINSAGDVVGGIPVASIALDESGKVKRDQSGEPMLEFKNLRRVPIGFSYAQGLVYLQEMLEGGPKATQGKEIVTTWTEKVKQYTP